jgi:predicted cupin superfamily sugar epimerase
LNKKAIQLIKKLKLQKHPEGGYYKQTYSSDIIVNSKGYNGPRHAVTAIYYLVVGDQFSAFHRLRSDEIWNYYAGGSLKLYVIDKGKLTTIRLGKRRGETVQAIVKSGVWFAAALLTNKKSYCLLGCIVSPGFEYSDWQLGKRNELIKMYPQHKKIIEQYATI